MHTHTYIYICIDFFEYMCIFYGTCYLWHISALKRVVPGLLRPPAASPVPFALLQFRWVACQEWLSSGLVWHHIHSSGRVGGGRQGNHPPINFKTQTARSVNRMQSFDSIINRSKAERVFFLPLTICNYKIESLLCLYTHILYTHIEPCMTRR